MTARKDHRPEPGSLEAALRELSSPQPKPLAPDHAENPVEARPGEHTPATPRTFDPPRHFEPPRQDRPGYTLWGRCGYVPSPRTGVEER